jgi:hypothetical protein
MSVEHHTKTRPKAMKSKGANKTDCLRQQKTNKKWQSNSTLERQKLEDAVNRIFRS